MKKYWLILNALLLLLASFLVYQLRKQWRLYESQHNPARLIASTGQVVGIGARGPRTVVPANYSVIPDNHLFTVERNNTIPPEPTAAPDPKVTAPKPILMGIMGLSGSSYALMVSGNGGESNLYRRLKIGEQLDGYTLVRVLHDKVVMNAGGQELDVRIADQPRRSQPAAQAAPSASAGTVSSLGAAGGQATVRADPQFPPQDAPEGTVFNGRRKRMVPSPFGMTVVWEDVK